MSRGGTPAQGRDWAELRRRLLLVGVALVLGPAAFAAAAAAGSALAVGGLVAFAAVLVAAASSIRSSAATSLDTMEPTDERRSSDSTGGGLERYLEALEHAPMSTLTLLATRPLDATWHAEARATARRAATDAGRDEELAAMAEAVSDGLRRTFSGMAYDPTMFGLAWRHNASRLEDRERLLETLTDAGLAVVVEDLIDRPTFDELVGPCQELVEPPRGGAGIRRRPS